MNGNLVDAKNRARKALLSDGVRQAVEALVGADLAASRQELLQEKITSGPERYVTSFQILAEDVGRQSYQMSGQVNIAMDSLRNDLLRYQVVSADQLRTPAPAGSAAGDTGAATAATTTATDAGNGEHKWLQQRTVLWVVLEKWRDSWQAPWLQDEARCPFYLSVVQDIADYGWRIVVPDPGALAPDSRGMVAREDAVALGRAMNIAALAYGWVTSRRVSAESAEATAQLQLIDLASGRGFGSVAETWQAVGVSDAEAAMELANLVVPRLDQVLSRPPETPINRGVSAAGNGPLLVISGPHPYAAWDALQAVVREQFPELGIELLELGPGSVRIHLTGVSFDYLAQLDGYKLGERVRLEMEQTDPQQQSVILKEVPVAPPALPTPSQEEQKP